jgi:hypothetical protein
MNSATTLAAGPISPSNRKRHTDQHLPDFVFTNQVLDMPDIGIGISPVKRFQRLGRPPELITQGKPDPLGAVIDGENPLAFHQFTLRGPSGPTQKLFLTRYSSPFGIFSSGLRHLRTPSPGPAHFRPPSP